MSPENQAAYIESNKARPLVVRDAPYTKPGPDQIVVRNATVAVNQLDNVVQRIGSMFFGWVKYPAVMGADVAGTVVEVGSAVTRFKIGDRVIGLCLGMEKKYNSPTMGAFQRYTVVMAKLASPIPRSLALTPAAVLPLALSTAACGLFQKDQLGLRHPSMRNPKNSNNEVLLVWGGSSSVGCNAIQLARAAGYDVVTTCSPKNFPLVQRLGAKAVFDYHSKTAIDDIVEFCRGKQMAGAMSLAGGESALACADVLSKCQGNRFISMASFPEPKNKNAGLPTAMWTMASWQASMLWKCIPAGIQRNFVWGSTLEANEVGKAIWEDYLPRALAEGKYIMAPEPHVVGDRLEHIQAAIDMVHNVSAKKCVITLE